jgi:sucrose-6-phosphate hydrolase SacC (GH32 family)
MYIGMDRNDCQSTCLATSNDLYHWEKYKNNPLFNGSGFKWIKARTDGKTRHLRDPHVITYQGSYLLYYTTYCEDDYSAVGVAVSDNLTEWTDLGPCYKRDATVAWLTESPLVFLYKDNYYLMPSQMPGLFCIKSNDPTDFHHKKQVDVIIKGADPEQVAAIEIIKSNPNESKWLVGYYLMENKRLFLGSMDLSEIDNNKLTITQLSRKEEVQSLLHDKL